MFRTTQTRQSVPIVFGAGSIAPQFENHALSRLVDDRETLYKEFVQRLHALVWCSG
jgi:hypothetical protein